MTNDGYNEDGSREAHSNQFIFIIAITVRVGVCSSIASSQQMSESLTTNECRYRWHNVSAALCHHYDVIRLRNVIGHMTIRLSIHDFLCFLNRNQTHISLSFHDVITDVVTTGSTIRVDHGRTIQETIMLKDNRSSNFDKNSKRRSILKGMTSPLWHHRVTWGHRQHDRSTPLGTFLCTPNRKQPALP